MKRVHQYSTKDAGLLWNTAHETQKITWAPYIKGAGTELESVEPMEWKKENALKLTESA